VTAAAISSAPADLAPAINEQHRLAIAKARDAIEHARRAGELLLRVKAALPHGAFLQWLAANVDVTPRQAQRYMAAALGKPMPVRAIKYDAVSQLPEREAAFVPMSGCAMWTRADRAVFFVEQSEDTGYFHASRVETPGADDVVHDYTHRPVRADYVELVLQQLGLHEPSSAAWRIARGCRVSGALGVPA
jgi:hypothetical protein